MTLGSLVGLILCAVAGGLAITSLLMLAVLARRPGPRRKGA